jgi:glycosyltransferase involved in cell wall biosynthesis
LVPLVDTACTNPADRRRVELVWHALRRRGFDAAIVTTDEAAAADADIVISQNRDFAFWNRHAPRLRRRGTRLIFTCSDLLATDTVSWSHSEESYQHKGLPWDSTQMRASLAEFLPNCAHVFAGSWPQARHLRAIAGESCPAISIDGDPIDLENYDSSCVPVVQGRVEHAAGQPFRMIWEGYVDNVPHLIVCAEAVRRLAGEIPVTVVVVTSRARRTPFFGTSDNQVLAERLFGAGIVEFHEWTPEAIAPLMRSAHAGLSPAFLGDMFNAARPPNKAILVNHMGLPVVASPTDANRGFVTDGINGFLADSSDEWYAALRTLAFDRKAAARMGRYGREKAAAFHPDAVVGRMLAALGELPVERAESPGELPRVLA